MNTYLRLMLCLGCVAWLGSCGSRDQVNVAATYDGGQITADEVRAFVTHVDKRRLRTTAEVTNESGMSELLRELGALKILASEAPPAEPSPDDILHLDAKARALVMYYAARIGKRTHEITDEEVEAVYNERLEARFTLPESITFQSIFLRGDHHDPSEIRSLEQRILAEYEAGTSFDELVDRYSESSNAPLGGRVGPVFRGRMDPDFEIQLFALAGSGRPEIIRTDRGSHVVLVREFEPSRVLTLDEVRPQIISGIMNRRDEAERRALFQSLEDRYVTANRIEDPSVKPDDVVLEIAGRAMTLHQLDDYLDQLRVFGTPHAGSDPALRSEAVTNLIRSNLMYLDAVDKGLDREPNFADRWAIQEMQHRANRAIQAQIEERIEAVPDRAVLADLEKYPERYSFPKRFDLSYIYLPFADQHPFEQQKRIEELAAAGAESSFSGEAFLDRCRRAGALCVSPGPISLKDAARLGPKFQRALTRVEKPGLIPVVKSEHGLFVMAVHSIEDRRPMTLPEDGEAVRHRFMELHRNEMVEALKRETLDSHHFEILRTEMFEHEDPTTEASDAT